MQALDTLIECGVTKPLAKLSLQDVDTVARTVALHTTILRVKAELDQFVCGLNEAGILDSIRAYPEFFRPMFVYQHEEITAGLILLLTALKILFSKNSPVYSHNFEPFQH